MRFEYGKNFDLIQLDDDATWTDKEPNDEREELLQTNIVIIIILIIFFIIIIFIVIIIVTNTITDKSLVKSNLILENF